MAEVFTVKMLNKSDAAKFTSTKRKVLSFAEVHAKTLGKARDNAPEVMEMFNAFQATYKKALGGFVGFARLFDPSMPSHPRTKNGIPGYQANDVYSALVYMRRLYTTAGTSGGRRTTGDPATDQLARSLKTVLQVMKDPAILWAAVKAELFASFNEGQGVRALARLQKRVDAAQPLIDLTKSLKPAAITESMIVHVKPTPAPQAAEAGNLAAPGQRVGRGAARAAA